MTTTVIRTLNDYECMLATSTCNVSLYLSTHPTLNALLTKEFLQSAWQQCIQHYQLLQVKLVPLQDEVGVLGNTRYQAVIDEDQQQQHDTLFQVQVLRADESAALDIYSKAARFERLKQMATSALDISKGSYVCHTVLQDTACFVVLSISHALSDGPGALQVAHTFLEYLSENLSSFVEGITPQQPLVDLQAALLGKDYRGSGVEATTAYDDLKEYQSLLAKKLNDDVLDSSHNILLPEAMQGLPRGPSSEKGCIDAIHVELDQDTTSKLVAETKSAGSTIQGVISAVATIARIHTLQEQSSSPTATTTMECAIQVPMNTRIFAEGDSELSKACLCGSAGVVHSLQVDLSYFQNPSREAREYLLKLSKECTSKLKAAIANKQPIEWLLRLMNEPATMPPYSLMASSIGISPVQARYGREDHEKNLNVVTVHECVFFGAALETSPQAQGTMIHVQTFDGRMQVMMNFTSPGIQKTPFMRNLSDRMESLLKLIANTGKEV